MVKTRVKLFHSILLDKLEVIVGSWLDQNSVRIVASSQSQTGNISYVNLTVFYEDVGRSDPSI